MIIGRVIWPGLVVKNHAKVSLKLPAGLRSKIKGLLGVSKWRGVALASR